MFGTNILADLKVRAMAMAFSWPSYLLLTPIQSPIGHRNLNERSGTREKWAVYLAICCICSKCSMFVWHVAHVVGLYSCYWRLNSPRGRRKVLDSSYTFCFMWECTAKTSQIFARFLWIKMKSGFLSSIATKRCGKVLIILIRCSRDFEWFKSKVKVTGNKP